MKELIAAAAERFGDDELEAFAAKQKQEWYHLLIEAFLPDGGEAGQEIPLHSVSISWLQKKAHERAVTLARQFGFRFKDIGEGGVCLLHPTKEVTSYLYTVRPCLTSDPDCEGGCLGSTINSDVTGRDEPAGTSG